MRYNNQKSNNIKGIVGLLVILAIISFFCCFRTIKSGQVGIKTRFGKVVDTQLNEGVNFKLPII